MVKNKRFVNEIRLEVNRAEKKLGKMSTITEETIMDERKLDRFDDAFLFCLGLVGLIISFIEIGKDSLADLPNIIPFVLLGIALPFVVGFLRGAIQLNSPEERVRGWIYFLVGTTSYLGFFIFTRLTSYNYFVKEGIFLFVTITGAVITYEFVKWTRTLFNLRNRLTFYSFSATALGVLGISFFSSLTVGFYYDFLVTNVIEKIGTNFAQIVFWLSIVLFTFSIVLIFEKGSRYAIQNELQLENEHETLDKHRPWMQKFSRFFLIKAVFLGLVLFEYSFDFNLESRNLQARTLWILSIGFWCVGSLFLRSDSFVASLFLVLAIIFCSIAAACFYKSRIYDFRGIEKVYPTKVGYLSMIFIIIVLIALGGNSLQLIVSMVLWTILCVLEFGVLRREQSKKAKTLG